MTGYDRTQNTAVRTFVDLTRWLLFDEWRSHARVGAGFLVLGPVVFFGLTALGTVYQSGLGYTQLVFFLVFAFGLQLGAGVFIQRQSSARSDAVPTSLLLLAPRSLPVSSQLVAGAFMVKQIVYYGAGVALPIAAGLAIQSPDAFAVTVFTIELTLMLGVGLGVIIGTAITARQPISTIVTLTVSTLTVAAAFGFPTHLLTPYYAYTADTVTAAFLATSLTIASLAIAVLVFSPTAPQRHRMVNSKFDAFRKRVPFSPSAVTTRTILLISRSRGGFIKLVIGSAIVTAVVGILIAQLQQQTAILHVGSMTGVLVTLVCIPLYYWLVQADEQSQYMSLPIKRGDVITSLGRVYVMLTLPIVIGAYVVLAQLLPLPLRDALLGGVISLSVATYVGGVLFYTAGLSPSTLTLRPQHFSSGIIGVALPLAAVTVFAFTAPPLTAEVVGIAVGICGLFALVGVWLFRRAASVEWPQS